MKKSHRKQMGLLGLFLMGFGLVPVLAAPGNAPDHGKRPTLAGWYVRLSVATPDQSMKDPGNVLGQLPDSVDGYDSHDLPEIPPMSARYLTIVFPQSSWGEHNDKYASDYRDIDYTRPDQWVFEVRTDNPRRDLVLNWSDIQVVATDADEDSKGAGRSARLDAAKTLIERMRLEDVTTGARVDAISDGQLQNYAFNMDGDTVRVFRWILAGVNGKAPNPRRHYPDAWFRTPAVGAPGQLLAPPGLSR